MTAIETDLVTRLVADKEQEILPEWIALQRSSEGGPLASLSKLDGALRIAGDRR
jgi:hypothetical protein